MYQHPQARSPSSSVRVHNAGPRGADGKVRCYKHDLVAMKQTSHTRQNPDRPFYTCSLNINDKDRCDFFKWADDPTIVETAPPASPSSSSQALSPRQYQDQRAMTSQGPFPPSSPQKRACPSSPGNGDSHETQSAKRLASTQSVMKMRGQSTIAKVALTPSQRQKRMEAIEAGLTSPSKDIFSPTKNNGSRLPSINQALHNARTPSPVKAEAGPSAKREEVLLDEDEDTFWRSPNQVAGPSNTSRLPDVAPEIAPGSEQWAPTLRVPSRPQMDAHAWGGNSTQNNMLLTPPHSSQPELGHEQSPVESHIIDIPETPTRSKSKGVEMPGSSASAWHRIQSDPESSFHLRAAALRSELHPSTPRTPSATEVLSADSVAASLSALSNLPAYLSALSDLPTYIRKLERKNVAAQKSIQMKNERIAQLEQENECLKKQKRHLESVVESVRITK